MSELLLCRSLTLGLSVSFKLRALFPALQRICTSTERLQFFRQHRNVSILYCALPNTCREPLDLWIGVFRPPRCARQRLSGDMAETMTRTVAPPNKPFGPTDENPSNTSLRADARALATPTKELRGSAEESRMQPACDAT